MSAFVWYEKISSILLAMKDNLESCGHAERGIHQVRRSHMYAHSLILIPIKGDGLGVGCWGLAAYITQA